MSNTDAGAAAVSKRARPAARRRTQAERSDEMQLRLVEAAATVLRKKGYAGLRTDEVARVAKASRGALQHQFPTKDLLVVATAEYLLRRSLERGRHRAAAVAADEDPIEGLIQDGIDFFLGPDFGVVLDLVLSGSKSRGLRDRILADARENRLNVEDAWIDVLTARGVPRVNAEKAVWLTISIVRGLAVRSLLQNDPVLFRSLFDEWKLIIGAHLAAVIRPGQQTVNQAPEKPVTKAVKPNKKARSGERQ